MIEPDGDRLNACTRRYVGRLDQELETVQKENAELRAELQKFWAQLPEAMTLVWLCYYIDDYRLYGCRSMYV